MSVMERLLLHDIVKLISHNLMVNEVFTEEEVKHFIRQTYSVDEIYTQDEINDAYNPTDDDDVIRGKEFY